MTVRSFSNIRAGSLVSKFNNLLVCPQGILAQLLPDSICFLGFNSFPHSPPNPDWTDYAKSSAEYLKEVDEVFQLYKITRMR